MRIIILAGGLGTRLGGITKETPKPMVPVAGCPFLTHVLDCLPEGSSVTLCIGYLKERVMEYFGDKYKSLSIDYSVEDTPLGTGGAALKAMRAHTGEKSVLLINGDTLFDAPLESFIAAHEKSGADITLALKPLRDFDRYGAVTLDDSGRITAFSEKKPTEYGLINGGIYALNTKSILRLNLPRAFSLEKDLFEKNLDNLNIRGIIHDSFFIDIGVQEDLERANTLLS